MLHESEMNLERWLRLMDAWCFSRNQGTYEALVAAYSERGRHYHTSEHVSVCLRHLDACAKEVDAPREVEVALWFHDAVYKPLSGDNEKKSADWAAAFLAEQGALADEIARVHRLVMVTEHKVPTQTHDESLLVDIDLSILGTDPEVYAAFETGVRKEYRLVPWFLYRKKRAEVLRRFLERPKIYSQASFSEALERQARENLANAISKLDGRA
jgi:predicted metal-dependent HD superfamily phosphohydrolase